MRGDDQRLDPAQAGRLADEVEGAQEPSRAVVAAADHKGDHRPPTPGPPGLFGHGRVRVGCEPWIADLNDLR